jgi:hypothetical protein
MVKLTRSSFLAWLVVGISASVLAVAPEAQAKCAAPAPVMAPWSGTVPTRPVLELLVPEWGAYEGQHTPPRVLAKAASGPAPRVLVKPDTAASGLKTFRVEIGAVPAGSLQVDLLDDTGKTVRSWSYVVDSGWKRPASSLAAITTRQVHKSWTCSDTNTTNLAFDGGAAGYRVVAASTAADLAAGRTQSFVIPRTMGIFWEAPSTSLQPVDLELGHTDCFGDTFDWSKGAVVAEVRALLPDGTEQAVTAKPISISKP